MSRTGRSAKSTTAILSALPQEQAGLQALLTGRRSVELAGREFVTGRLHGLEIVLALSGIGKVAAAVTASVLCAQFAASRIVFTGVAGALAQQVQVGDVVLGSQFVQHDLDVSPLFARYVVPSLGRAVLEANAELTTTLKIAINDHMTATLAKNSINARQNALHIGLIASGDQFIGSGAQVLRLRSELPDALCVEMEGAAVAQVCADFGVPFAAMRMISDRADDTAHVDFAAFIQTVAGPYALGILSAWLKNQAPPAISTA